MYDNEFGDITINIKSNMRQITARWRNDVLIINMPPVISRSKITLFIDENREKLRILREKTKNREYQTSQTKHFHIGQIIPCFRSQIHITTINHKAGFTAFKCGNDNINTITISCYDNIDSEQKQYTISCAIKRIVKLVAPKILIPYAWEIAEDLGLQPKEFIIGHGLRKLGHCTSSKVIQLSENLLFLPEELVRYIICHELAHLTHMNHSKQFHDLCNIYCNGKEKAFKQMLKGFNFPI